MRTRLLLLVVLTLCVASLAQAEDWTRFRGPNGTGVSPDKNVPVRWAEGDVRFRVELPGKGHSSPIIVGKRLFLLSATNSERLALCYDAASGKSCTRGGAA